MNYIGPEPFSEIETRNVRDFILKKKGDWIFFDSIHSYSQLILLPWSYTNRIKPGGYDKLKEISDIGAAAIMNETGEVYQVKQFYSLKKLALLMKYHKYLKRPS